MQDYEANRIIIQRQSLDWSAENYSDRGAAENFAYAILPENCVEERVALADATLELIELWNSVFDIRFHTCRAKIKEIAHINWREVNQCDEIWYDFNFDQIRSKFMGETVVALFTDDDDWFAPDVFSQLNEATSQSSAKGWLWKRSKFDGTLSSTELGDPLYAFTNNYALDGRMFDKGSSVKKIAQHSQINREFLRDSSKFGLLKNHCLSVSNKTPCSHNILSQVNNTDNPKNRLVQKVEEYAASVVNLPIKLSWSKPYCIKAQSLFREVVESRR